MSNSNVTSDMLIANNSWAHAITLVAPKFFSDSAQGQEPKVLWIGCADSRVPESVITVRKPGDVFVHRNIANQFPAAEWNDTNSSSALQYAVEHLKVDHIVVVGHTKCGGASAAYDINYASNPPEIIGPLRKFLEPLIQLAARIGRWDTREKGIQRLIEVNVKTAVATIAQNEFTRNAKKKIHLHGWVYALETGHLRDLGVTTHVGRG